MINFWKWICILGIGLFYLSVLYIIPQGIHDLISFFKDLKDSKKR